MCKTTSIRLSLQLRGYFAMGYFSVLNAGRLDHKSLGFGFLDFILNVVP